jgi:hypothetical protein
LGAAAPLTRASCAQLCPGPSADAPLTQSRPNEAYQNKVFFWYAYKAYQNKAVYTLYSASPLTQSRPCQPLTQSRPAAHRPAAYSFPRRPKAGPRQPCRPCRPVPGLVGLVGPFGPVGLVGPFGPVGLVGPVGPVGLVEGGGQHSGRRRVPPERSSPLRKSASAGIARAGPRSRYISDVIPCRNLHETCG